MSSSVSFMQEEVGLSYSVIKMNIFKKEVGWFDLRTNRGIIYKIIRV